jgi:multicomponent Na+:H+ antiporter subunit G
MTGPVFALAAVGVALMAVAAVGLLRMPDLLTRMHASSKAGTLGAFLVVIAVAVHFREPALVVRALLVGLFLLLTAPVASHVIARAAYRIGVPLSPETVVDELAESVDGGRNGGDDEPPAAINHR